MRESLSEGQSPPTYEEPMRKPLPEGQAPPSNEKTMREQPPHTLIMNWPRAPVKYFDKTIDELSLHEKAPRSYEPLTLKEDSEGAINKPPPYFEHQLVPRSYEPPEDTFKPSPHLRESISKLPPHEKQDPSSYQPFKLWEEYENPEEYESSSHY
jgi:hypothetical protein